MKSEQIAVTSKGLGISEALALTEEIGKSAGLDEKSVLHLRLLAEEVSGMLRGIAGDVEAMYWLEAEGRKFELHLQSTVQMTAEMKEQFISASTEGKNAAAVGFMGKIKVMIAGSLLSAKEALPYAMVNTASAYSAGGVFTWSMDEYRMVLQSQENKEMAADDAWDELEKSIVAKIADDVKVSVVGKNVEIIVFKTF